MQRISLSPGSATLAGDVKVVEVSFANERLTVFLSDGRVIATPLNWYPRLVKASAEQRNNWQVCGAGQGVHWPDIDEDLSIEGMLAGRMAHGGIAANPLYSGSQNIHP